MIKSVALDPTAFGLTLSHGTCSCKEPGWLVLGGKTIV